MISVSASEFSSSSRDAMIGRRTQTWFNCGGVGEPCPCPRTPPPEKKLPEHEVAAQGAESRFQRYDMWSNRGSQKWPRLAGRSNLRH
jgi:hypothetical protein